MTPPAPGFRGYNKINSASETDRNGMVGSPSLGRITRQEITLSLLENLP